MNEKLIVDAEWLLALLPENYPFPPMTVTELLKDQFDLKMDGSQVVWPAPASALFAERMYNLLNELKSSGSFYMSAIEAEDHSVDFEEYEERLDLLLSDIAAAKEGE